jgi:hypothetical protein
MVSTSDPEAAMNAFYEHHRDSIRFGYRCFDRILLNGLIQPFQQPSGSSASSILTASSTRSAAMCCAARPVMHTKDVLFSRALIGLAGRLSAVRRGAMS